MKFLEQKRRITNRMETTAICKILITTIALVASSATPEAWSAEHSKFMLKLEIDGIMWGPATAYLSNEGIRIRERLGDSLVAVSNPTRAFCINPENKSYLPIPIREFICDLRDDVSPIKSDRVKLRVKSSPISGFQTSLLSCFARTEHKELRTADFVLLKNTNLSPVVHQMWCRFLGFDSTKYGLPVECNQLVCKRWATDVVASLTKIESLTDSPKRWVSSLKCSAICRLPFDSRLFAIPKTWKRAKDKAAFSLSNDGEIDEKDIEDLFMVPLKK